MIPIEQSGVAAELCSGLRNAAVIREGPRPRYRRRDKQHRSARFLSFGRRRFLFVHGQMPDNASHSELWLTESAKVIFMSYYIPLPDLKAAGLGQVWEALDVVARIITQDGNFHIALPVEFRFIKGGDSAMSGAYSDDPNTWFLNVEYGAFGDRTKKASDYPPKLLKFFADVERQWVAMEGIPHGGKMYGFYDPTEGPDRCSKTGPFNPNFLASVRERRGARLEAFNAYRQSLDPNGLFYNDFLRQMLEQP
jgi:FAD/FMN-containing dehydrogenase